jgi:ParB family transcriptional regulator, chromosome partitioning protein
MAKPKGGLGRGLGALISSPSPKQKVKEEFEEVKVGKVEVAQDASLDLQANSDVIASIRVLELSPSVIVANPHQPRKVFREQDLEDLVNSIREHGILQPLVVTELGKGQYELIAGERRLRASREAGLDVVPVIVRAADEQQKLELALIENIQRSQLDAVEEAYAYESLADLFSLTQAQIAERVGKSRSAVANTLRLLELDEEMLQALSAGEISRSHARTLLGEKDRGKRKELFEAMKRGEMTVREAEVRTSSHGSRRQAGRKVDPNITAMEDELRRALGTKVKLQMKGAGGKLTIDFYSKQELKALIEKLSE